MSSCLDIPILPAGAQRASVWAPAHAHDRPRVGRHLSAPATTQAVSNSDLSPRVADSLSHKNKKRDEAKALTLPQSCSSYGAPFGCFRPGVEERSGMHQCAWLIEIRNIGLSLKYMVLPPNGLVSRGEVPSSVGRFFPFERVLVTSSCGPVL